MKTTRKWISLILILALAFSFTLTSASADADAVKAARNSVVRVAFPFQDETGTYIQQGSGFFVGNEGAPVEYIITNAHVVEGATSLKVITSDGETYEAQLIGSDTVTDLAVVKIDATGLTAAAARSLTPL